jgi:hypothetical protein
LVRLSCKVDSTSGQRRAPRRLRKAAYLRRSFLVGRSDVQVLESLLVRLVEGVGVAVEGARLSEGLGEEAANGSPGGVSDEMLNRDWQLGLGKDGSLVILLEALDNLEVLQLGKVLAGRIVDADLALLDKLKGTNDCN